MNLSANLLYGLAAFLALVGLPALFVPIIGAPILFCAYLLYLAAGKAKRKARELEVRRQQGG